MADFTVVGPGGSISAGRVVAIGRWDSAPVRREVRRARVEGKLIDLTYGHACRWVFFMDTGHVVLGTQLGQDGTIYAVVQ
ncbi:DUF370 domain-containing protein [bacterium]|nr:DUF370 domain-containing protein [bacterium]OIO88773.1 MAG: hypothetical protein AUK02_03275 [Anaerolineae bacterium CG2_30_58_95]PIW18320.1 MAG: hypothetical protein COW33_05870 [Anaerolineae bacterium CG17_big_fil_post_rev_8_21_14_2_50_57_27]PJH75020.1 MAG: hypothetical protein CO064_08860 [Anaerolineae bacterium CG_4_9_14_0_8_um_filter_58_9]